MEFRYDADGVRTRRSAGGTVNYYFAGGEYEETAGVGEFTYYHSVGGSNVAMTVDGELTWVFSNNVCSASTTRTESGQNRVQRYTPYGELRTDGNLTIDRQYTGQISDESTGLYFYNARYYDPLVGRFISPDTIIPDPGDGQDFNRYMYVRGNPIKYNDPTGHDPCADGSGGCGGVREGDDDGDGWVALDGSARPESGARRYNPGYVCEALCGSEGRAPTNRVDPMGSPVLASPQEKQAEVDRWKEAAANRPDKKDISRVTLCFYSCVAFVGTGDGEDSVIEAGGFGLGVSLSLIHI